MDIAEAPKDLTAYFLGATETYKSSMKKQVSCDVWRKTEYALRGFREILKDHSDYERLCLLYKMMTSECHYDLTKKRRFTGIYISALRNRTGVCASFAALLFLFLSEVTSYQVYYVVGSVGRELHAWNIIESNGVAYHLDPTWDLGKESGFRYFLVSDSEMKGRDWDRTILPVCDNKFAGVFCQDEHNAKTLEKLRRYYRKIQNAFENSGDFTVD